MAESLVLVVDDEKGIRDSLADILKDEGYRVQTAESGEEALRALKKEMPDIVFLDVWLSGMDGVETLREMKSANDSLPVVMISGHGNIELAVKATKMGAYDFLEKPLSLEKVLLASKRALERGALEAENRAFRESLTKKWRLIGESPAMKELRAQIGLATSGTGRVLITGESGTGKELVARMLHLTSQRAEKPFVEVNCAAIPQELIESELFGHEKGSFTGAFEQKKGKFELADGGTLFLDEIGDMSLQTQAKVLRVIETQEFQRVGGSRKISVDVWIMAATNKNIAKEAKEGRFREDLFFRLNVIPLCVSPLRERKEDIPPLAAHFLETIGAEYGKPPKGIAEGAMNALRNYDWPGNVRELRNLIERLVIMTTSGTIEERDVLFLQGAPAADYFSRKSLREARDAFERDFLIKKLEENGWNISKTAEALEIERSNLHRKIKSYGIKMP